MKNKKHFFRALLRRRIIVIVLLLFQLTLLGVLLVNASMHYVTVSQALNLASIVVVLYVVNKREKGDYKLIWSLSILVFPFFGGLFYLLFQLQGTKKKFNAAFVKWWDENKTQLILTRDRLEDARKSVPEQAPLMTYLQKTSGFPVYGGSETEYFSSGEEKLTKLLEALNRAERFIFLEYYLVEVGTMWDRVLEILERKAGEGLDVRMMYDDMGCFLRLPKDYPATLTAKGIKCTVYGPFRPVLSARQNNRNHRKIAVVDGKVAFTGGINIADEYINLKDRFSHWKDAAVMVEGEAAWSFTMMFLQMWSVCNPKTIPSETNYVAAFKPQSEIKNEEGPERFIQPYADNPTNDEKVGRNVYLHIIHSAQKYVYINTPYLIIDDILISELCLAAKSGVDVRIMTPHLPDKKYVQTVTRSFYRELLSAGVRVFEYRDGFVHAKTFVSDDRTATVGTANLDYRSLYLHFECGLCIYDKKIIAQMRDDFIKTLESCFEINADSYKSNVLARFYQDTLRLVSPVL